MSDHIDEMLAQKIRALYALTQELEDLLPGRHYTPDGYLIGSIGEAWAAKQYGLTLLPANAEKHDAQTSDGRMVQIKVTQTNRIGLRSEPKWLLVLQLNADGYFSPVYNGPGAPVWKACGKMQTNGQCSIALSTLRRLQMDVPQEQQL